MKERIHPTLGRQANSSLYDTSVYCDALFVDGSSFTEEEIMALGFIEKKEQCNHSYQGYTVDGRDLIDPVCQKCGKEKQ